eukprot:TRINITY_DN18530_c0_g1::TRINITY_DN18530_c0_g1_i1::g.2806::m.2806 TRINITY_DN18530_c0_g1::TRINITY_DN18530_c0_g1_i1::g.2806  ORF type:complete len:519 (+),score=143.85,sp/P12955/PEPD_HUMAN/48.87/2e-157,Peptidase_M24/PF00557.19/9.5e-54,AMP_N/PF05195.11/4.9e-32,DUF3793/PF12672.2/0.22 TRINITY_DN18530_c0_g1_i1:75-1559(+)
MACNHSQWKKPTVWPYEIPMELHKINRQNLLSKYTDCANDVILLQGGVSLHMDDTDMDYEFRQESNFQWTFGVEEPGFYGLLHTGTKQAILFIQRYPEDYSWWMGEIQPPQYFKEKYQVDAAYYVDELVKVLEELKPNKVHVLFGENSDSGHPVCTAKFDGMDKFDIEKSRLYVDISNCRAFKSELELKVMRFCAKVSSDAHVTVMQSVKPGMKEYECASLFKHYVYSKMRSFYTAYSCISASGRGSCTLHYHSNDKEILAGELCLFDMGGEYKRYASDITCTFPSNGKFSDAQKQVYNIVLKAVLAVEEAIKPGVEWTDMHLLAERVMTEGLVELGIIKSGFTMEELEKHRVGAVFFPHGLGHLLGLDVHDVGGYTGTAENRPRLKEFGLKSLRTRRVLESGLVLTVEPGLYFIEVLIDKALNDPEVARFLDADVLNKYRHFGGVRIEDDVAIHADGAEILNRVPRTVEQIEACMAGQDWKALPDPFAKFFRD